MSEWLCAAAWPSWALLVSGRACTPYLGGNEEGARLSRLYDQNVKVDELPEKLGSLFARFKAERDNSERFGIFVRALCGPSRMQPMLTEVFNDCRRDWTGQRDVA